VRLKEGDEIFAKGNHDGSVLMVATGEARLAIHDTSGRQFTKRIGRGENVTSSLSLLAAVLDEIQGRERLSLLHKIVGSLSATAAANDTIIFRIPSSAVISVLQQYPDSFFRLAQAAISQVEKITSKSLVDHFGIASRTVEPVSSISQAVEGTIVGEATMTFPLAALIAESFGAIDNAFASSIVEHGSIVECEDEHIIDERVVATNVCVVLRGHVRAEIPAQNHPILLFKATTGCEVGLANCFSGSASPATRLVCEAGTLVLLVPESVMARFLPTNSVAMACAFRVIQQYSSLVCVTDNAFDSIHIQAGETLFHRGDLCDSVFTLLSGRLRAIQVQAHRGRKVETTNELVRGATLGAMDMLAAGRSNSTVFAVRDSLIAQMPRCVFDFVVNEDSTVLVHFTTNLAKRLSKGNTLESSQADHMGMKTGPNFVASLSSPAHPAHDYTNSPALPLSTIAVISLTKMTKIKTFCSHLESALKTIASTGVVSSASAKEAVGVEWSSNSRLARANMSAWLGEMESSHDVIIYEGDPQLNHWTNLCVRQADHVLLLCSDTEPPQSFLEDIVNILQNAWTRKNVTISVVRVRDKDWTLSAIEAARQSSAYDSSRTSALKRRLRVWKQSPILPRFLLPMEKYEWISSYHNVQTPFDEHGADFLRLSRRITGRAVGLVLGGGGARGLAHIGVLRALEECGVHVDVVGGTSIGAFIGAMYALHPHHLDLVTSKVALFSISLSSIMEKLRDLTLPIAAFFNGHHFNKSVRDHFFDLSIEDMVLNYFCVTTDIAKSRMSVHRSGAVWKYVRASMSLQGYLPPISENGSLLLDGGYMNNLPADVMKEEGGIKYVLAVDVGSEPRRDYYGYGTTLSGWWLLWNKLNPFAKTVSVPSMGDVSAALAYVSSEQHKERMKAECIDLYLRPPVLDYGTLQFEKSEEIIKVGYDYALPRVKAWAARVLSLEPDADIVEPSAKIGAFRSVSDDEPTAFESEYEHE
jgi:lysophospholipid hydrolase